MDQPHVAVSVRHGNAVIGAGLVAILSRDDGIRVHENGDGETDRSGGDGPRPIVVTDYRTGLALLVDGSSGDGRTRPSNVIMFTARDGSPHVRLAIARGVSGYVLLDDDVSEIVTAVRRVAEGSRYLCPAASRSVAESLMHLSLTQRELEVLRLVAQGLSNKLIARELSIALGTVKAHVKAGLEKLGARCRTEGVARARERGLLERVEDVALSLHAGRT